MKELFIIINSTPLLYLLLLLLFLYQHPIRKTPFPFISSILLIIFLVVVFSCCYICHRLRASKLGISTPSLFRHYLYHSLRRRVPMLVGNELLLLFPFPSPLLLVLLRIWSFCCAADNPRSSNTSPYHYFADGNHHYHRREGVSPSPWPKRRLPKGENRRYYLLAHIRMVWEGLLRHNAAGAILD